MKWCGPAGFLLSVLISLSSSPAWALSEALPQEPGSFRELLLPGCKNSLVVGFGGDFFLSERAWKIREKLTTRLGFLFETSDKVVVNFEGSLGSHLERAFPHAAFALSMPDGIGEWLQQAGVSGVTLANNHTMDFGEKGLLRVLEELDDHALVYAGAGRNRAAALEPMRLQVKGRNIHILSFNATFPKESWADENKAGTAYPSVRNMERAIRKSRAEADVVIASFHWGQESNRDLREYQPRMAKQAIDFGADFVFGHHSHIAQGIEVYNGKSIAYGLGNFIFDSYSRRAPFGMVAFLRACLSPGSLTLPPPVYVPILTNNYESHLVNRALTLEEFLEMAAPYFATHAFEASSLLYFPEKRAVRTLREWRASVQYSERSADQAD